MIFPIVFVNAAADDTGVILFVTSGSRLVDGHETAGRRRVGHFVSLRVIESVPVPLVPAVDAKTIH